MRKPYNFHWSYKNTKLKKTGTVGFGIPAYMSATGFITCPHAKHCVAYCYARQGMFRFRNKKKCNEKNLATIRKALKEGNLYDLLIEDLKRFRKKSFRIHDSGDFFSQRYLDTWKKVAKQFPEKKFYAYTKSVHLDLYTDLPDNFVIIQSEGGKRDDLIDYTKPHSRVFPDQTRLSLGGYVDGSKTDYHAMNGTVKIGLIYHGDPSGRKKHRKIFEKTFNTS